MDPVFLARLQFGFTAGFHFLFPPTTLGLTLVILILESFHLRTGQERYKTLSSFLIKILAVVFVMGVATGITLEFAFGNNWSNYSRMVGDVFGAPLAAEGIFAFFLESIFLAVLVFGRRRVSRGVYWLAALFVFIGSHLSGFWILIANSWMQTPAGFRMEGGRAVLTDFFAAAFNPSTMIRFLHTIAAGWVTGSLLAAAAAAWLILKKKDAPAVAPLLRTALAVFIAASLLQLGLGHAHSVQVARTQPEKMAAFEGLWETQTGAPFTVFGIPDVKAQKIRFQLAVPGMLSWLIHFDAGAEVKGLNAFPPDERPPVVLPFLSYHLMILLGLAFIGLAGWGLLLFLKKRVLDSRLFLKMLLIAVPLPYLANTAGWIAAEVGRQPWAVYKVLRTADAASPVVPAGQILATLILFILVYSLIAAVGVRIMVKLVKKGPGAGEG
ncbi:MAG: cytochrome ubiquinol oxidase subunit I [Candidatus Aminicenantes bacterium]|nr:cytochrome ubiquinol oxidase subunit I [Candidatus Aminicenantes bacterium]